MAQADHRFMYLAAFADVFYLSIYGVGVMVLSIVVHRKHRNPLAWGLIGGLFGPCSLIYLSFLPRVCPKCRGACNGRACPNCDDGLEKALKNPVPTPLVNAV